MRRLVSHPWTLWLVLSLPAVPLLREFVDDRAYYPELMDRSGVLACQLLVLSLAITPLGILLRRLGDPWKSHGLPVVAWLVRRRRHIGVASAGYVLIHTLFYLRQTGDMASVLAELRIPEILLGWIALVIFLVLALTSNNFSVSRMGAAWKTVHRAVYLCAIASFLHWLIYDYHYQGIFLLFLPLAALQIYRVSRNGLSLMASSREQLKS